MRGRQDFHSSGELAFGVVSRPFLNAPFSTDHLPSHDWSG
jgi:hypothetical protein